MWGIFQKVPFVPALSHFRTVFQNSHCGKIVSKLQFGTAQTLVLFTDFVKNLLKLLKSGVEKC